MMYPLSLIWVVLVAGAPGGDTTVTRWSNHEPTIGVVVSIADQGVEIRVGEEIIPQSIPWYDVQKIEGASSGLGVFRQTGDDAWRAHARLSRGDYPGAERIYEKLGERYLWKVGGQSSDVSLGLLLCRLDRADRVGAVMPYLSWMLASEVFTARNWRATDPVGFDAQYGLLVELPPIFGVWDASRSLGELPENDRMNDRQRVIFGYFQIALDEGTHRTADAGGAIDRLDELMRGRENRDPGIELFKDMVVAQAHPDAKKRVAARASLERRGRAYDGTWLELWARLGIGVSLLGEDDAQANELGVIELIHVIVRLDHLSPALSLLAAQIADEYLRGTERASWGGELVFAAQAAGFGDRGAIHTKEHAAHD